jgi:hypothetical protein
LPSTPSNGRSQGAPIASSPIECALSYSAGPHLYCWLPKRPWPSLPISMLASQTPEIVTANLVLAHLAPSSLGARSVLAAAARKGPTWIGVLATFLPVAMFFQSRLRSVRN